MDPEFDADRNDAASGQLMAELEAEGRRLGLPAPTEIPEPLVPLVAIKDLWERWAKAPLTPASLT